MWFWIRGRGKCFSHPSTNCLSIQVQGWTVGRKPRATLTVGAGSALMGGIWKHALFKCWEHLLLRGWWQEWDVVGAHSAYGVPSWQLAVERVNLKSILNQILRFMKKVGSRTLYLSPAVEIHSSLWCFGNVLRFESASTLSSSAGLES